MNVNMAQQSKLLTAYSLREQHSRDIRLTIMVHVCRGVIVLDAFFKVLRDFIKMY